MSTKRQTKTSSSRLRRVSKRLLTCAIVADVVVLSVPVMRAQAPVITDPFDLVTLGANEAYDPAADSWTQKTPMPTPRLQGVIEQVNGIIYAVGGIEGLGGSGRSGEGSGEGITVPLVEAYDPVTDSWTTKTPMPAERCSMTSGTIGGTLYVAGGYAQTTSRTNTLFAYDAAADTWTTKHAMPRELTAAAAGVIDGKLYVVGGDTNNGFIGNVIVYDPATDSWDETKAPMPTARAYHSVVVLNGKLYAIGGALADHSGYTAVVEAYDPATDTWTTKTPLPSDRAQFAAGEFNNIIYAAGGIGFRHPIGFNLNDLEAFDPAANGGMGSWTQKEPMPTPRSDFGGQFINGIFYAIGGNRLGTATVGQPYTFQVTATNNPTSYGASGLPPGLSIDGATGINHGIPTAAERYQGQVSATNGSGTGQAPFSIGVFPAPDPGALAIVSSTCATGRTGQPFSFAVLTSGGGPTTHLIFGTLPPGLSGNRVTGIISGTPTSADSFTVSVTAVDGASVASSVLQLTFTSDPGVPIITSPDFATLIPGQFFSYTITADNSGNCSYIGTDGVENGALPAGLSFNSATCIISGTYSPSAAGVARSKSSTYSTSAPVSPGHGSILPDTITIRPPLAGVCQLIKNNSNGTGTFPLNFFQGSSYSMTIDASPSQGGAVNGGYNSDSSFTATATPNSNYSFENWTENGQEQSTSPHYTFTPTSNRTLVANFAGGSGPLSLMSVVSRKINDAGTKLDVDLTTGSGIECRSGGPSTMIFSFSKPVTSCGVANTGTLSSGPNSNQCSVQFSAPNGQYTTVQLSGVNGSGAVFSGTLGVLLCDTNGDGYVDSADIAQVKSQSGKPVSSLNFREDLNGDGFIDSADIAFVKSKSGSVIPPPPVSPSVSLSTHLTTVSPGARNHSQTSSTKAKSRTAVRSSAQYR